MILVSVLSSSKHPFQIAKDRGKHAAHIHSMLVQTAIIFPRLQPSLHFLLLTAWRCAKAGMHKEEKVSFYKAQAGRLGVMAAKA